MLGDSTKSKLINLTDSQFKELVKNLFKSYEVKNDLGFNVIETYFDYQEYDEYGNSEVDRNSIYLILTEKGVFDMSSNTTLSWASLKYQVITIVSYYPHQNDPIDENLILLGIYPDLKIEKK